jgi:hypothetical protein
MSDNDFLIRFDLNVTMRCNVDPDKVQRRQDINPLILAGDHWLVVGTLCNG